MISEHDRLRAEIVGDRFYRRVVHWDQRKACLRQRHRRQILRQAIATVLIGTATYIVAPLLPSHPTYLSGQMMPLFWAILSVEIIFDRPLGALMMVAYTGIVAGQILVAEGHHLAPDMGWLGGNVLIWAIVAARDWLRPNVGRVVKKGWAGASYSRNSDHHGDYRGRLRPRAINPTWVRKIPTSISSYSSSSSG